MKVKDYLTNCPYCGGMKGEGWHGCPQAKAERKKLDATIEGIHLQMKKPNYRPQTNAEMRLRHHSLQAIKASILLQGGEIKDDYKGV